jgi:glycosyltransferase involved in cell wall biosynthesis
VRLLGRLPPDEVLPAMARHLAVVMPSVCYEGFPRALVEAFATGTPVIASRIGALAELVQHGETGLLVPPGDAAALADAMRWALEQPQAMREMGRRARQRYLEAFTPERNLPQLLQIYAQAREEAFRTPPP